MKKRSILTLALLVLLLLSPVLTLRVRAADLDEILRYDITVDVNEDATLHMICHVDWKVLDSDSEGPLSWVEIGVPNRHYSSLQPRSAAVSSVSDSGSCVRVDLDRSYYAGEVAEIEFELVQDYMYQVNELAEGETVFHFTPGWFDNIRVDALTIRWNSDRAIGQTPSCLVGPGGYYTWEAALDKGEQYSVSITYPNSAFAFDESKTLNDDSMSGEDIFYILIGLAVFLPIFFSPLLFIIWIIRRFNRTANFSASDQKKITRTKIVYYPVCQGCGAPRPEGKDNCAYCGRSFIKSEETIQESDIPAEEADIRQKSTNGLYRYHSQPDTYVRIHVTPPPIRHSPHRSYGGGYHGSSHSSSRGSPHSSCAHSSCACACACACAGGGRAGCSVKDFYNTNLRLRQLERLSE